MLFRFFQVVMNYLFLRKLFASCKLQILKTTKKNRNVLFSKCFKVLSLFLRYWFLVWFHCDYKAQCILISVIFNGLKLTFMRLFSDVLSSPHSFQFLVLCLQSNWKLFPSTVFQLLRWVSGGRAERFKSNVVWLSVVVNHIEIKDPVPESTDSERLQGFYGYQCCCRWMIRWRLGYRRE